MSHISVAEHKVSIMGGSVYVKTWTPDHLASASPLILLHDSLGCTDLWRDFPAMLAAKLARTVICYDRLGFGQSTPREECPSLTFIEEEASRYFPAIKKHLRLQQYALLGHSVGGAMAINIAAKDPDCKAVVTMSAQAFVEARTIKGIIEAKKIFAQPQQMARLEKYHGAKAQWVLHAWTQVWLSPRFENWNLLSALTKVRCPVLAIHGEHDEYGSPAFPAFIKEHTGGKAETLIMQNCAHMPHKEMPHQVIKSLNKFLGAL